MKKGKPWPPFVPSKESLTDCSYSQQLNAESHAICNTIDMSEKIYAA